jgi:hypothetical protein
MHPTLALDIGGANLKAAHSDGTTRSVAFEVWRRPGELTAAVTDLIGLIPVFDLLAVTMTAELCDCFATKHDGVTAVLDAVERAVREIGSSVSVRVWLTDGRFVAPDTARAEPLRAAAANWLATATWAGRFCPTGNALVVDVGSTTTDIVPLRDGKPTPHGRTDFDRLATGELVYSGIRRTPLCAVTHLVTVSGRARRVAAELFATTEDVHLWRGDLAERPKATDTADGRPATRPLASARLARMVCADRTMLGDADVDQLAEQFAAAQLATLAGAARHVADRLGRQLRTIVIAGGGEFLARRVAAKLGFEADEIISIGERFGPAASAAACAFALAVLASEQH